jgi:hypothetical protein
LWAPSRNIDRGIPIILVDHDQSLWSIIVVLLEITWHDSQVKHWASEAFMAQTFN